MNNKERYSKLTIDDLKLRCAILPHIGSATLETRVDMAALAVKNALAVIDGEQMPASLDLTRL